MLARQQETRRAVTAAANPQPSSTGWIVADSPSTPTHDVVERKSPYPLAETRKATSPSGEVQSKPRVSVMLGRLSGARSGNVTDPIVDRVATLPARTTTPSACRRPTARSCRPTSSTRGTPAGSTGRRQARRDPIPSGSRRHRTTPASLDPTDPQRLEQRGRCPSATPPLPAFATRRRATTPQRMSVVQQSPFGSTATPTISPISTTMPQSPSPSPVHTVNRVGQLRP